MSKLDQHIIQNWSLLSSKKIFLGCSGGVDSMTLLSILHKAKWDFEVLHVNYQLRGKDSEADQQLVEETCKKLAIPCHVYRIDLQAQLDKSGGNLQEKARIVRYDFFESKKQLSENNYIVLAQHEDDQIETFFMHLARKSGIMGMACMPTEHHRIIRPLLPFSKEEIIHYAQQNNVEWREDYSNKTNKYVRNILRNIILPDLQNQIPSLKKSILLLIEKFQETQNELEKKITPLINEVNDHQQISFAVYDALNEVEKIELFRQLGQKAGLAEEVNKIRFSQKGKRIAFETASHSLFYGILREDLYFQFLRLKSNPSDIPELTIEKVYQLPAKYSKDVIYLDASKIKGKLKLRKWLPGDRMKPLGMKGSKLLSDVIKDAKTPSNQKENILVLVDDEKILWCVGIRISGEAVTTEESEEIWKVSIN